MRYNTSAAAIHGVVTGNPNMCPRMNPVAGCRMPAGVVNHQSARTTSRATTAWASVFPLLFAKYIKYAGPKPVPTDTTLESTCNHFTNKYALIGESSKVTIAPLQSGRSWSMGQVGGATIWESRSLRLPS